MSQSQWLLMEGRPWRIGRHDGVGATVRPVKVAADPPSDAIGPAVASSLRDQGYGGEDVILGLDSRRCLAAPVQLSEFPQAPSSDALLFALEPSLPLSAEEIVADFIRGPNNALGVAVTADSAQRLVESSTDAGVSIGPICPTAILAWQWLKSKHELPESAIVAWKTALHYEVFATENGILQSWTVVPLVVDALRRHLLVAATRRGQLLPVILCGCDDSDLQTLSTSEIGCSTIATRSFDEAAIEAAAHIARGSWSPLIDLRRDALADPDRYQPVRGLLRGVAITAVVALAAVGAAFQWRAHRYEQIVRQYEEREVDVYRQLFPAELAPAGIRSRLESEARRLSGMNAESESAPRVGSALETVNHLLAGLPTELRFRLQEIRIEGANVSLDGEVRTHGDATVLASAIAKSGFQVESPSTAQTTGGHASLRLTARHAVTGATKSKEAP